MSRSGWFFPNHIAYFCDIDFLVPVHLFCTW